ncbi:MAG: sulfotransferase [Desulfatibacillum sp.]|nr:sulfotransferase [Desulfatibacillum sp.]
MPAYETASLAHDFKYGNRSSNLPRARGFHDTLFQKAVSLFGMATKPALCYCQDLKHVILIASASRSGSSWLANLLQESTQMLSLPGEFDPLLFLAQKTEPSGQAFSSDRLNRDCLDSYDREQLSLLLSWMSGRREPVNNLWRPGFRTVLDTAMRTVIQWPEYEFDVDHLLILARASLQNGRGKGPVEAMLCFLKELAREHGEWLSPYYYDLPYPMIRKAFPHESLPLGPPSSCGVIEEPPFIPCLPWRHSTARERGEQALIIKSPSNSYRLDFLQTLFPNARLSLIHVIRNPVSSISGLMCGWRHHGFFKHILEPESLDITGYSSPLLPWSKQWWKFDLPPGWKAYTHAPLEEVCKFQWLSANNSILEWARTQAADISYIQIRYESLVRSCKDELRRLCKFLNTDMDHGLLHSLEQDCLVMASAGISQDIRGYMRTVAESFGSCPALGEMEKNFRDAEMGLSHFHGSFWGKDAPLET